jgi:hypothetical protein
MEIECRGEKKMNKMNMYLLLFAIFVLLGCDSTQKMEQVGNTNKNDGEITYTTPQEWISEIPSSKMRKAQFRLPAPGESEDAEMAVFNFPGTGGSVEANLERWYGQFKQPDGSPTSEHAEKYQITVNGLEVTVVYTTGTFLQSTTPMMTGPIAEKNNFAMLAAIVEISSGPWFFKVTGPRETIDFWREDFLTFVKTFRLSSS